MTDAFDFKTKTVNSATASMKLGDCEQWEITVIAGGMISMTYRNSFSNTAHQILMDASMLQTVLEAFTKLNNWHKEHKNT